MTRSDLISLMRLSNGVEMLSTDLACKVADEQVLDHSYNSRMPGRVSSMGIERDYLINNLSFCFVWYCVELACDLGRARPDPTT